jgi:hypothetical protein
MIGTRRCHSAQSPHEREIRGRRQQTQPVRRLTALIESYGCHRQRHIAEDLRARDSVVTDPRS